MTTDTHVIFDVSFVDGKKAEGRLLILGDESLGNTGIYSEYPCISGPHGKGALPFGTYNLVSCFEKDNTDKNKAYRRDGVPWLAGILPQFETERNNLAIHPDGNVPGSLGCAVITKDDMKAKAQIETLLKKHKQLTFKVC